LLTIGAVAHQAELPADDDIGAHIAYLRELPVGTTVTYRLDRHRKRNAGLQGLKTIDGQEYIVLSDRSGPRYVPARNALRIEVSRHQLGRTPKVSQVRSIRNEVGLAAGLNVPLTEFLTRSRFGVAVVGSEARLHFELTSTFAVEQPNGQGQIGRLQDLARVRAFGVDGESYRSQVFSPDTAPDVGQFPDKPTVTVFDGARAFLRGNQHFSDTNWILALDRAEPRYDYACSEVDRLYTTRRLQNYTCPDLPPPPVGIEYTAFGTEGI
jgi:hypothetical protein